jgi:hypothetical protein
VELEKPCGAKLRIQVRGSQQAAQGELLMNDDTTAKILDWMGRRRSRTVAAAAEAGERATVTAAPRLEGDASDPDAMETMLPSPDRKGLYTMGIVAERGEHHIALFSPAGSTREKTCGRSCGGVRLWLAGVVPKRRRGRRTPKS